MHKALLSLLNSTRHAAGTCVVVALVAVGLAGSQAASAQNMRVSAGTVHSQPASGGEWTHDIGGALDVGVPVSDYIDFYGAVGLGAAVSLEFGATLRPWRDRPLEPYLQAGYGRYEFANLYTSVLPVGAGLHYQLSERTGIFFELERRISAVQHPPDAGLSAPPENEAAWMPRTGLSFGFGSPSSSEVSPEEPTVSSAEADAEQAMPASQEAPSAPTGINARFSAGTIHTQSQGPADWQHDIGGALKVGLPVSDYFDFYGAVGLGEAVSLELGATLRPWRDQQLEPYLQAGYGRYEFADLHTSVLPVGAGLHYQLSEQTGVFVELDRRIMAVQNPPDAGISAPPDNEYSWTPRIGLSFGFGQFRPSEDEPSPDPVEPSQTLMGERSDEEEAAADTVADTEPDSAEAGRFGDMRFDPNRYEGMELLPDGIFIMGQVSEDPLSLQTAGRKHVTVNAFYIDDMEVSNADYREYMEGLSADEREAAMPDSTVWAEARSGESWDLYFRGDLFADYPVVGVNWNQAQQYCEAQGGRLPTEAEWEYAARAGNMGKIYPWDGFSTRSENGQFLANYQPREGYPADGYAFTAPVNEFPPNDWGLYNVVGNVAEWTRDAYTPSYENISDFNPFFEDEEEERRVVRGGSWASTAYFIGVGVRSTQPRDEASINIGFRCAREVSSGDAASEEETEVPASPNGEEQP